MTLEASTTILTLRQESAGAFDFNTGSLTLNTGSELSLGVISVLTSSNGSAISNFAVSGTTSLAGTLTLSRTIGTVNLGALTTSTGGVLNLTAGSASDQGASTSVENIITVSSLAGSAGTIQSDKASTTGALVINGSATTSFGGVLQNGLGTVRLAKQGVGIQTLSGANTYTGTTTVTAGTLAIASAGSISDSSAVTVSGGAQFRYNSATARTGTITLDGAGAGSRATLSGTGPINVALTLDNVGDTLSPGNSPGIQLFGVDQTWDAFTYVWETNNFTGTTAGTDFDQIGITGGLTLTGGPASYVLDITSLTGSNDAGAVPNFSEIDRTWTILSTTAGITGFNATNWTLNTAGFTSSPTAAGAWSLVQTGNDLVLNYSAIPEPSNALFFAVAAAGLILLRRLRKSSAA